ncbi:DUF1941 family protein [Schizosaccharomyces octosporus yFS286]|uniref:DUF1941 family protein n=1 Tax=Schizosaccharomyces octosporus (strain yFS286) TaxID=483514 RepID=S9PVD6_SCHOY|nr:DUF1941 family protein [Schizosaccharomyces octosporus yFS286]EPX71952.1 DUF1941 family protein [Schizosaccharomyces octosporus yFS286]
MQKNERKAPDSANAMFSDASDSFPLEKFSEDIVRELDDIEKDTLLQEQMEKEKMEHTNKHDKDNASALLENCFALLHAKDDTSKFVSLTMLAKLLNENPDFLFAFWEQMDMKFLDRLLRSKNYEYADLGVSVLLAFCSDEKILRSSCMKKRIPALLTCTMRHYDLCIPTICALASNPRSAKSLLYYTSFIINEFPLSHALEILSYGLYALDKIHLYMKPIFEGINKRDEWKSHVTSQFFRNLFARFPVNLWYSDELCSYLRPFIKPVLEEFVTEESIENACVQLFSILKALGPDVVMEDNKESFLLVIGRCTAEIRANLDLLVSTLDEKQKHESLSYSVCTCYEVLGILIHFLCENCDELSQTIEPTKFFQLQNTLSELFGDTMEFIRDAWDNMRHHEMFAVHVTVVSAIATLCLWLTEDDSQYKQASGLIDVFMALWKYGWKNGVEYAKWIGLALPNMLQVEKCFKAFKNVKGWEIVWDDFKRCNKELEAMGAKQALFEDVAENERATQAFQDFYILLEVKSILPSSIWEHEVFHSPLWKDMLNESA